MCWIICLSVCLFVILTTGKGIAYLGLCVVTKIEKFHHIVVSPARRHEHDPRWSSGAASARSPRITDRRPGEVRGRRVLVILDRNTPMGRPRGVGSIANFNLPKYPRDLPKYPREKHLSGSEPLKRARSVCDAERFSNRRIPPRVKYPGSWITWVLR